MTYRSVPARWRLITQLATLAATAAIGVSLMLTPSRTDVKLSEIEQALSTDVWGLLLVIAGTVGFFTELFTSIRKTHQRQLFWLISMCHIICLSLMLAYGVAALVGLIQRGQWWNFAAPVLAALIALWHFIYVKRRPREPMVLK